MPVGRVNSPSCTPATISESYLAKTLLSCVRSRPTKQGRWGGDAVRLRLPLALILDAMARELSRSPHRRERSEYRSPALSRRGQL